MKKNKKFFGLLAIFGLAVFLSGCSYWPINNNGSTPITSQVQANPELEKQYQKELKEILVPFWQAKKIDGLRDQVLELVVPQVYLELHLDLVLAFDLIEEGQTESDQAKIEQGLTKLNNLAEQYPWLK